MEQLTLFEKRCECGRKADIIQQTIYEDEYYCFECYNLLTENTQEVTPND